MRVSGSLFWGLYLIIIGTIFLLRQYFNMNIPVLRLALGAFLIMAGLTFMFGQIHLGSDNDTFFGDGGTQIVQRSGEHNIVFSSRTIDLSKLEPTDRIHRVEVNTIFSSAVVYLDPDSSYRISGTSAFGTMVFPNGNTITFGDGKQVGPEGKPVRLDLEVNTVFGKTEIRFVQSP